MTAVRDSINTPKYRRGENPRSLANLRTPWQKGESGNAKGKDGPKITPHLRRLAGMSVKDFYRLPIYELTMAEAIAAGILTLAIQSEGGRERNMVLDRLDGSLKPAGSASLELADGEGKTVRFSLNLGSSDNDDSGS